MAATLVCGLAGRARAREAVERRIAVVVGNDFGAPGETPLRFAQRDATRIAQVLTDLGGVRRSDLFLVLGGDDAALKSALTRAESIARAERSTVLFYYSGHADDTALHLGPTRFAWSDINAYLARSQAGLRIALLDACQSGTLTAPKGFTVGPPAGEPAAQSGTAVLAAAGSLEAAQEAMALGGSYFTHFLISALRGAADLDGDRRVTLAEAHTYTTAHTTAATSAWARSVQHPTFRFEISGHGDVVLTDLGEAAALLRMADEIEGHVVVTEKGSPNVVVETEKRAGQPLRLALSAGRYVVHVRKPDAVYVAEATLPWGGEALVEQRSMVARSYQTVALKGDFLEVHRHSIQTGVAWQSPPAEGMGAVPALRIGYGFKLGPFELGTRLIAWQKRFATVDTEVTTQALGAGLALAYEWPFRRFDLLAWLFGEGQRWRQDVLKEGRRQSGVFDAGAGVGARLPLSRDLFAQVAVEAATSLLPPQTMGARLRPLVSAQLSLGTHF